MLYTVSAIGTQRRFLLWIKVTFLLLVVGLFSASVSSQNLESAAESSVYVEPIKLSEVRDNSGLNLNIGAVVVNEKLAEGLQKGADIYGLKLDLFVMEDPIKRAYILRSLIEKGNLFVIVEGLGESDKESLEKLAKKNGVKIKILDPSAESTYADGVGFIREARATFVNRIPKYEELLPIAFPVSPLPDNFFQPSKFPYPSPLVRAPRTTESFSASVHAHTSCNMVAQTGNMLHRTSSIEPNRLLMGMEGGNLSLNALPGAIDADKISAVMTSWVLKLGGGGVNRLVLVENNGLESSLFEPGIHAPEELELALDKWKRDGVIGGFVFEDHETLIIRNWRGKDETRLRAGLFLVANEKATVEPVLEEGKDRYGNRTIDFYSTQAFVQQLSEIPDQVAVPSSQHDTIKPYGGILTKGGATIGSSFGQPLANSLRQISQAASPVKSYVLALEGGFIVTTPEKELSEHQLSKNIKEYYLDLRGPLTSDQTINIVLEDNQNIVFRRTIINFSELDEALNQLKAMGLISGWDYEGARGRGLFANIVLYDFLGKNRKFMSSLSTWPTEERLDIPLTRMYVDGMQRLNFAFVTKDGWRQEFVEVPLRMPPVPRDIALYSGASKL